MLELAAGVMADFANPEVVGTNPQSLLLLLPAVAAIAIIYKATKLPSIAFGNFLKESVVLFFSIIVFMVVTAMVLTGVAWLILE
jgi:hypothetical protein